MDGGRLWSVVCWGMFSERSNWPGSLVWEFVFICECDPSSNVLLRKFADFWCSFEVNGDYWIGYRKLDIV